MRTALVGDVPIVMRPILTNTNLTGVRADADLTQGGDF